MTRRVRYGYIEAMQSTESPRRTQRDPDVAAAQLLIELREKRGLAREDVPHAMAMAGIKRTRIPSVKTIWRVEELGHTPSIGIKAAFADFYERDLHTIWPPHVPRCAA